MVLRRQNRLILAVILSILVVLTCNAMGKAEAKQTGFIGGWQRGPDAYNPNRVIYGFPTLSLKMLLYLPYNN